jgi:hypothetical protein
VSGLITPDFRKPFTAFPISAGVEANNTFNIINALGEVGWVPYYQPGQVGVIRATKIGIFLQGGYKFGTDSAGKALVGGQIDQSGEPLNAGLFRAKGSAAINTNSFINIGGFDMGLVGTGDLWYDFIHGRFYDRVIGKARLFLTPDKYFDFVYQHGSGAPNFNTGTQYGVDLTIRF